MSKSRGLNDLRFIDRPSLLSRPLKSQHWASSFSAASKKNCASLLRRWCSTCLCGQANAPSCAVWLLLWFMGFNTWPMCLPSDHIVFDFGRLPQRRRAALMAPNLVTICISLTSKRKLRFFLPLRHWGSNSHLSVDAASERPPPVPFPTPRPPLPILLVACPLDPNWTKPGPV